MAAGILLLGIGIVGYVTPLLPGTVFLVMALGCFTRSSPRMESWMLGHPWFGTVLSNWKNGGCVTPRIKVIAISMIWLMAGGSAFGTDNLWIRILMLGLATFGTVYLLTRPSHPATAES